MSINKHITFRCPPDLKEKLDKRAKDTGRKRTGLLIQILRDFFDNVDGKNTNSVTGSGKCRGVTGD